MSRIGGSELHESRNASAWNVLFSMRKRRAWFSCRKIVAVLVCILEPKSLSTSSIAHYIIVFSFQAYLLNFVDFLHNFILELRKSGINSQKDYLSDKTDQIWNQSSDRTVFNAFPKSLSSFITSFGRLTSIAIWASEKAFKLRFRWWKWWMTFRASYLGKTITQQWG